jgi:hypothetical protein
MAPDATRGAPSLVVDARVDGVVAGRMFAIARGLVLRFGLGFEYEFCGGMPVAVEAEMGGGKEVEVAVDADEGGSVLLDEREFQLVVLRSAMGYAAIGIGDNSSRCSSLGGRALEGLVHLTLTSF